MSGPLLTEAPFQVVPDTATYGMQIRLKGSGFGGKKGKVSIKATGEGTLKQKILSWSDGEILVLLTKVGTLGEAFTVTVSPPGKSPLVSEDGLYLAGPLFSAESIGPNHGPVGTEVTVTGHYFGAPKGRAYLAHYLSSLYYACVITSWSMDAATGVSMAKFRVPRHQKKGVYDVMVMNGLNGDSQFGQIWEDAFTVE